MKPDLRRAALPAAAADACRRLFAGALVREAGGARAGAVAARVAAPDATLPADWWTAFGSDELSASSWNRAQQYRSARRRVTHRAGGGADPRRGRQSLAGAGRGGFVRAKRQLLAAGIRPATASAPRWARAMNWTSGGSTGPGCCRPGGEAATVYRPRDDRPDARGRHRRYVSAIPRAGRSPGGRP